jgi:hypothetical protein
MPTLYDSTCNNLYLSGRQHGMCAIDCASCPGIRCCPYTPEYTGQRKITITLREYADADHVIRGGIKASIQMLRSKDRLALEASSFEELGKVWANRVEPSIPALEAVVVTSMVLVEEPVAIAAKPIKARKGVSKHPLYSVWIGIKGRCNNPVHCQYSLYGGKGVVLAIQWLDFETFATAFPEYEKGDRFQRKDWKLGYVPGNCVVVKKHP